MLLAYLAAILIGVSLGLIGGGGSILTVPVLVYLFHLQPAIATSYSLFVVGSTSLVGTIKNKQKGLVNIKIALLFSASSIATVLLVRRFILPRIPATLFSIGSWHITHGRFTMLLFALLMIIASIGMISERKSTTPQKVTSIIIMFAYGALVGAVTGLLGAGGGFLIIPALVLLCRLDMKNAIGTSMLIITLNSLFGFMGDTGSHTTNWLFLFTITGIAILGLLLGSYLSSKVNGSKLKKGFGWSVLIMGIFILLKEIL